MSKLHRFLPYCQPISEVLAGLGKVQPLAIDGPPCTQCRHWHPVVLLDKRWNYDGIRLCHGPEQFSDFSCFEHRPEKPA
jgi:hypothetical protein